MRLLTIFAGVPLALSLVGCRAGGPSVSTEGSAVRELGWDHGVAQQGSSGISAHVGGLARNGRSAYNSRLFSVSLRSTGDAVEVLGTEWTATTDQFYKWKRLYLAHGDVLGFCARHAVEYYVIVQPVGAPPSLERWTLQMPDGAYFTEKAVASVPIGASIPPSTTALRLVRPYIPPAQRSAPIANKQTLLQLSQWGDVILIAVDPEGRFLVGLVGTAEDEVSLLQLNLQTGVQTELAKSDAFPGLVLPTDMLFLDSVEEGRILTVRGSGGVTYCCVDAENDGVFEAIEAFLGTEYFQKYPTYSMEKQP